jgi:hypothetical protein
LPGFVFLDTLLGLHIKGKPRSSFQEGIGAGRTPVKKGTWSHSHTCWYVPFGKEHYDAIQEVFERKVIIDMKP